MSDRNRRPASGRQAPRAGRGSGPIPSGTAKGGSQRSAKGVSQASHVDDQTGAKGAGAPGAQAAGSGSHNASGATRAGRREFDRRRQPGPATPTLIDKLRKPLLVAFVVVVVAAAGLVLFTQNASPAYACSSVDTVQSPAPGELGQVQDDQGNQHVQPGEKVTYKVCPPASGSHINQNGLGPIQPKVYGPNEQTVPNGWVHNLEHGGLVLLYSCDKGACDSASTAALAAFSSQFPPSPVCQIPPQYVGPVVTRFEQMPTRYAALVWDRALYLDTLDTQTIDQFFLRFSERLASDGKWIAPPEPQCNTPSASPAASGSSAPASAAPSASGG